MTDKRDRNLYTGLLFVVLIVISVVLISGLSKILRAEHDSRVSGRLVDNYYKQHCEKAGWIFGGLHGNHNVYCKFIDNYRNK